MGSIFSYLSTQFSCNYDYVLVPPVQIDRYVDSIAAVESTTLALSDLNTEKTDQQLAADSDDGSVSTNVCSSGLVEIFAK